jgi:xanthine dehydrogenase accessory factor
MLKIGDIDPRGKKEFCYTISEKSRCVAGSVLLAIMANLPQLIKHI